MTGARAVQGQDNQGRVIYCFGFRPWKHHYVRRFLASEGSVRFVVNGLHAQLRGFDSKSRIVVWGSGEPRGLAWLAAHHRTPVWRMEDGFLRSVGLGAERYTPASLVLDRQGIYYDPRSPSDLECILRDTHFDEAEVQRAKALRERIVALALSKYNVGDRRSPLPARPAGKRTVFVPGQVQDDASIRYGCLDVNTNLELLRAVRERRPDAFIVFKPHPDVLSGNRLGAVSAHDTARYADAVVEDAPLPACLALADEVHTMTSLVGFEGLLRGLEVHCYGLPFYAGWGLTQDRHSHPRRSRVLELDELVAGALIRYPLYRNPETLGPSGPEEVVDQLGRALQRKPTPPIKKTWKERQVLKLANAMQAMRRGREE